MLGSKKKRKTVKTLELLSISGLCHIVDVSQNTAANWIEDFNVYFPEKKQNDVTYYHPEAINVLKFIKACKNQNYQKPQIMEMLANQDFPITEEKTIDDLQLELDQVNYKDNLLTVMQTIGKTVTNVSNQEESIKGLQEQQNKQHKRLKHTEKQTEEIHDLKREIKALKQDLKPAKEYEMKKKSFAKLFES